MHIKKNKAKQKKHDFVVQSHLPSSHKYLKG